MNLFESILQKASPIQNPVQNFMSGFTPNPDIFTGKTTSEKIASWEIKTTTIPQSQSDAMFWKKQPSALSSFDPNTSIIEPMLRPIETGINKVIGGTNGFIKSGQEELASRKTARQNETEKKINDTVDELAWQWYTQEQIMSVFDDLNKEWFFKDKPWVIEGMSQRLFSSLGSGVERVKEAQASPYSLPEKSLATWVAIPSTLVSAPFNALFGGVIETGMDKLPDEAKQKIAEAWQAYDLWAQQNPRAAFNVKTAWDIAAIAPTTKTWQNIIKAPAETLARTTVDTAQKIKSIPSKIFPSAEQKIANKLGSTTKGMVWGKTVLVPTPQKWIIEKVTLGIGRESDPKVLAWRALTPSYAGKTNKQILSTVWDVEKNVRTFYEGVRKWEFKGDISTLENAANSVVQNLDNIGSKIGEAVKDSTGKIAYNKTLRAEMKKVLSDPIEKRGGAYKILENFYKDTSAIDWLSIQRAFKAKKIYQAEIGKLIKAGDVWTDAYATLVKAVQQLNDSIDDSILKSMKWPKFATWKKQYASLKKIATDISKSAAVEWRRSPQTFVEQLWTLNAIIEWVSNPLSTARNLFAKEIGELNTRGGAWKELIKIYDTKAIKAKPTKKLQLKWQ